MKPLFSFLLLFCAFVMNAQSPVDTPRNVVKRDDKLTTFFKVDGITKITVTNTATKKAYTLTEKELTEAKKQLLGATGAGGLLEKQGHILIDFYAGEIKTTGEIYPGQGILHFHGVTTPDGRKFSTSFYLPNKKYSFAFKQ
jgi:hypothetical protein